MRELFGWLDGLGATPTFRTGLRGGGLYSFNFGESGKSVVTPTEKIAIADGEKQIFNYTVINTPS